MFTGHRRVEKLAADRRRRRAGDTIDRSRRSGTIRTPGLHLEQTK
ncbi:MAG: hypothetical protein ACRDK4_06340 [Solirubrobacteraceae bacterium]